MLRLLPRGRCRRDRAMLGPRRLLGRAQGQFRDRRQGRQAGRAPGAQECKTVPGLRMPARRDAHRAGNGDAGGRPIGPAALPAPDRTRRPRLRHPRAHGPTQKREHHDRDINSQQAPVDAARTFCRSAEYAAIRSEQRKRITEIKRHRRLEVGPFATFYFENYETMRHQVQEMLHIEKGGDAQIEDELAAYNPLIPQGKELVATVMFEIDDPAPPRLGAGAPGRDRRPRVSRDRRGADPRRARPDPREHQPRGQGLIRPVPQISVHRTTRSLGSRPPARR